MSGLSPLKPVETAIPDKNTALATDLLQSLALAAIVSRNGGKMVFPLSDLNEISQTTLGLNVEVISSQHTPERFAVFTIVPPEPQGSKIIQ